MSKAEILEYFNDINYAYNNSGKQDSLSNMLDEFEQEIRNKAIDEFTEKIRPIMSEFTRTKNPHAFIDVTRIAEQMKGE